MIMWTQLMAATVALFMQAPLHFYQAEASLAPNQQQVIDLQPAKLKEVLYVQVQGSGGGDLDCYLLVNHRIVSKDEGNADMCYLGMYVNTNKPIKLWIVNHGKYPTHFQARVDQ